MGSAYTDHMVFFSHFPLNGFKSCVSESGLIGTGCSSSRLINPETCFLCTCRFSPAVTSTHSLKLRGGVAMHAVLRKCTHTHTHTLTHTHTNTQA